MTVDLDDTNPTNDAIVSTFPANERTFRLAVENAINGLLGAGITVDYAGTAAPSGWLMCYGQAVSRTTYAALFTAIGTTYGIGDGSTTFNLPDCRGRVIAGQDDMGGTSADRLTNQTGGIDGDTLGAVGGAETHTLTEAQMPAHTHTGTTSTDGDHSHSYQILNPVTAGGDTNSIRSDPATTTTGVSGSHSHTLTINSTGGDGAHNNVQPTIIMNKIIKT